MERMLLSSHTDRNGQKSRKSDRKCEKTEWPWARASLSRGLDHPAQITFFFMTFFTLTGPFFEALSSSAIRCPHA